MPSHQGRNGAFPPPSDPVVKYDMDYKGCVKHAHLYDMYIEDVFILCNSNLKKGIRNNDQFRTHQKSHLESEFVRGKRGL